MNAIQTVSSITVEDIAEYLRIDELDLWETTMINTSLNVAKAYIQGYTGLTVEQLDEHPDFVIVVLVLCQDMYDNRTLYVDIKNLNNVVDAILGMHRKNLL